MKSKGHRRNLLIAVALAAGGAMVFALVQRGQWHVELDVPLTTSPFMSVHRIRFEHRGGGFDAVISRMPRAKFAAKIVDAPDGSSLSALARDSGAMLAVNGGYFDAALKPVGLLRIDGTEINGIAHTPPVSGVVAIDKNGSLEITEVDAPSVAMATSAFQAGPFVIDAGGQSGIHASDGKAAERTIIATSAHDGFVIVTTPATLFDVAAALVECSASMNGESFDRAINLDGGPSSGFVIDAPGGRLQRPPRGQIRNAVLFFAKN